jgi:hypothetical protein
MLMNGKKPTFPDVPDAVRYDNPDARLPKAVKNSAAFHCTAFGVSAKTMKAASDTIAPAATMPTKFRALVESAIRVVAGPEAPSPSPSTHRLRA